MEKMKDDEKETTGLRGGKDSPASSEKMRANREVSQEAKSPASNSTDVNRFIGSAYWRSLTNEVRPYI